MARRFSMRRSGISQISAAITKITWAILEERKLATIARIELVVFYGVFGA